MAKHGSYFLKQQFLITTTDQTGNHRRARNIPGTDTFIYCRKQNSKDCKEKNKIPSSWRLLRG